MTDDDIGLVKNIHALLVLFGERYIHVSDEQALLDCKYSRENMVAAFDAILSIAAADDAPKIRLAA